MAHGGGGQASSAVQLTPRTTSDYVNGTWSQLASMNLERLFFPTEVLPSGKVLAMEGEYSDPNTDQNLTNTGEMYDPVTNTWTSITDFPQSSFRDDRFGGPARRPNSFWIHLWPANVHLRSGDEYLVANRNKTTQRCQ